MVVMETIERNVEIERRYSKYEPAKEIVIGGALSIFSIQQLALSPVFPIFEV